MKETILNTVSDLVSNFTYYDRKNDEDLTEEDLDKAIKSGEITLKEISEYFFECLKNVYSNNSTEQL